MALHWRNVLSSYRFLIALLIGIVVGSLIGIVMGKQAVVLKPVGDIFLNLLYTIVVPLVAISIASAVAGIASLQRLGRILGFMMIVFTLTGIVASLLMLVAVKLVPPAEGVTITLKKPEKAETAATTSEQIVAALTVPDFPALISKKNLLPLIIFAVLFGLATALAGEPGRRIAQTLSDLSEVVMKLVGFIMILAPVGLGAYFAALIGEHGPQLLGTYARAMAVYYPLSLFYFGAGFTFYIWLAGGGAAVRAFWRAAIVPSLTALGTGSSVATIPANLTAAQQIGVPVDIREMVIPIGATIHMEGSCLSAILKIAFLFGLYQMPFDSVSVFAIAIGVAILSGTVMAGIPGGGFAGELLIVYLYGFPPEALPVITTLGILVDPPATMVNSIGDTVTSIMVTRILEGKNWMARKLGGGQEVDGGVAAASSSGF